MPPPGTLDTNPPTINLDGNVYPFNDIDTSLVPSTSTGNVTYPTFPNDVMPSTFNHNYMSMTVDRNGRRYRQILQHPRRDLHCEQLALHLALRPMLTSYHERYGTYPSAIFLYSFFLPCPNCYTIIHNAINDGFFRVDGHEIPLYVGFTELTGGTRGETHEVAQNRYNDLNNLLTNVGGALFWLLLYQTQIVCNNNKIDRYERSVDLNGKFNRSMMVGGNQNMVDADMKVLSAMDYSLELKMNFVNASARVRWYDPNLASYSYSYIELVDSSNSRKAWFYMNGVKEGERDFGKTLEHMYKVNIYKGPVFGRYTLMHSSGPWKQCGYGWKPLSNAPPEYGKTLFATFVQGGIPKVLVGYCSDQMDVKRVKFDKIIIQTVDGTQDNDHKELQSIQIGDLKEIVKDYFYLGEFNKMSSAYASGFRLKYVACTDVSKGWFSKSCKKYAYFDFNDNALPFWEPEECSGSDSCDPVPFHSLAGITEMGNPCTGSSFELSLLLMVVSLAYVYASKF